MAFDAYKSIQNYVEMKVGAPVVALCDSEQNSMDNACAIAAGEYWTAVPHLECGTINAGSCVNELRVNIADLKDQFFETQQLKDDSYFLGLVRYEFSDIYNRYPGTYNHFDYQLLGSKVNTYQNKLQRDPRYIADRIQQSVTTEDILFGELEYRVDNIRQQVVFLLPEVEGTAQIWYGWGFCPEKTLNYLPPNHVTAYKQRVAFHFLDALISARSAISLTADYDISTDYLTKLRDEIKEEADKALADISLTPMTWG